MKSAGYKKFLLMMGVSFLVMYLVMYLNLASLSHFYLNINRAYKALLMVAPMALIMLVFMRGMYRDKKLNLAIAAGSILLFLGVLLLERSQTLVQDEAFMRSMIPHHSSVILVSENADLKSHGSIGLPSVFFGLRFIFEPTQYEIPRTKEEIMAQGGPEAAIEKAVAYFDALSEKYDFEVTDEDALTDLGYAFLRLDDFKEYSVYAFKANVEVPGFL